MTRLLRLTPWPRDIWSEKNLSMPRIWRGGCLIRLLDLLLRITKALDLTRVIDLLDVDSTRYDLIGPRLLLWGPRLQSCL